jgi:hypothetical protein
MESLYEPTEEKLCPLKTDRYNFCLRESCAWWNQAEDKCSILVIANYIWKII